MSDKDKNLTETLSQIEKQFGKGTVMKMGDREIVDMPCVSTGSIGLDIALGIGSDTRIGSRFLRPGPAYGGSCFPKDTKGLVSAAEKFKTNLAARFYTALAKQITDGVFGSTGVANPSGAYTSPNGEVVNWYKNTTTGTVNGIPAETVRVTILKDGVTTTIDYPYADSE